MAITFPASPSDGDVFTNTTTGVKYIYNATDGVWKTQIFPTNTNYLQLSGGTITGGLTARSVTTVENATVGNGLTLSDGDITVAAGHGINFSADANASGMTNELLDDYEEGTWTPTFGSNGVANSGTVAYSRQSGHYIKIGNKVWVRCRVTLSNVGTVSFVGHQANVLGLPFPVLNVTEGWTAAALGYSSGAWGTAAPQAALFSPGTTHINMYTNGGTSAQTDIASAVLGSFYSNTADVIIAGCYYTG